MGQCVKSWKSLSFALFCLMFIATGSGFNILGTYWNQYNMVRPYASGQTWIIIGNIMNVVASFLALYVMIPAFITNPTAAGILAFLIVLGIVIDLYFTFLGESSDAGDALAYAIIAFNTLPRFIAVLLGYGICSIPDAIDAMKVLGGRKR
jgi:hypothetical protein